MRFDVLRSVLCLSFFLASTSHAATYYVRAGGNDSADGLSPSSAWGTLSRLKRQSFRTSDRVLLREGDTFAGPVSLSWAGTASSPAVFGAYYLEGSTPKQGFKTQKPVVEGGAKTGHYEGIVKVRASYFRVENIKTINPAGRGIDVLDAWATAIVGCTTDSTYNSGIHLQNSSGALLQNNYVSHAGLGSPQDGAPWGGAIEIHSSNDVSVKNNFVVEVYGEGINANHGSDGTVIEANNVYASRAVGIYSDAAPNTTIRRNIVTGTTNSTYWRSGKTVGAGIALNNEKYHYTSGSTPLSKNIQTRGARVYDNLVTFTSTGIALWGELAETSFDNVYIFNNTLVDNDTQVFMQSNRPKPGGKFMNNILLSLSSGTRDAGGNDLAGMTAKNNYFSKGNPGGGYQSSTNKFSGLSLTRMSGWRSVSDRSQLSWRDFAVKSGSSVIGAGDGEPERMTSGDNTYAMDYNNTEHNAPMDMGGLKFSTTSIAAKPSKPGNLVLNE